MNDKNIQKICVEKSQEYDGERVIFEILATTTEELGEVAQEILLLEKVGGKKRWTREGSVDAVAKELSDLLTNIFCIAEHYDIDIEEYIRKNVDQKK